MGNNGHMAPVQARTLPVSCVFFPLVTSLAHGRPASSAGQGRDRGQMPVVLGASTLLPPAATTEASKEQLPLEPRALSWQEWLPKEGAVFGKQVHQPQFRRAAHPPGPPRSRTMDSFGRRARNPENWVLRLTRGLPFSTVK